MWFSGARKSTMEFQEVILGDGGKKSLPKLVGAPRGAKSPSEELTRFRTSAKHGRCAAAFI